MFRVRIGTPSVGPAYYFSFNNPNGMCPTYAGIGKIMDFDINNLINSDNTYDKDIISIADEVIDIGPLAGKNGGEVLFQGSCESLLISGTKGGEVVFTGTPKEMIENAKTITAKYLRK